MAMELQEPLSSLEAEYKSGSPILLEKIKVLFVHFVLLLFLESCFSWNNNLLRVVRYSVTNVLPFVGHAVMGIAFSGALCFRIL